VLSLVVLDSSVAASYAGWTYGLAVLALLLVALPLSRLFAVT
jgi:4-hydroxybenzoate polyprenyltransferase